MPEKIKPSPKEALARIKARYSKKDGESAPQPPDILDRNRGSLAARLGVASSSPVAAQSPGGTDEDDTGLTDLELDATTGEDLPTATALAASDPDAIPTAPPRLPILTPDEARQIRNDLRSPAPLKLVNALKGLDNKEPSKEWGEILELATRSGSSAVRCQIPAYAARLATFLSSDDLSHDRALNAAGLNFFREFPNDQDPSVANQATGYLNDLVLAKHFLPREVRKVAGIVTLYLKKHSDDQGIDDRGMERGNVLGLVRDLIEEVDDIHQAINESRPPRAATPTEQKTIERIHQFLYHLFKAVLNSPDRENYPETVINDILDILENFPDCLEYKAVCNLPLSNKEKITIMTGRTSNIVNGVEERREDGVGIAEIRDEFKGRGFALKGEAEFFMWEGITDAEVQAKNNLIRATDFLDERLWGTDPSIELGDIDRLLEIAKDPVKCWEKIKRKAQALLENDKYLPAIRRNLVFIGTKIAGSQGIAPENMTVVRENHDWLSREKENLGRIILGIIDPETLAMVERATTECNELLEIADDIQAALS